MSNTKPPPGTGKPFLGDDDLKSELDAWDATFDALHETAPAGEAKTDDPPPMEWPPAAPSSAPVRLGAAPSSIDELAIDEPQVEPAPNKKWIAAETGPGETDFSELGAQAAPSALGEMLGRPGVQPPMFDDPQRGEDEEEVFTSASRPELTKISAPPVAQTARTSPAIIRRTTTSMATAKPIIDPLPSFASEPSPSETTKMTDLSEIEARAFEAGRNKAPTAPPPILEDDYADIEIDATPTPMIEQRPASAPVRRTAHVMRRSEAPGTKPPAMSRPVAPQPVAPKPPRVNDPTGAGPPAPPAPTGPAAEDDFSDVAAAVGASEDMLPPAPSSGIDGPTNHGGPEPRSKAVAHTTRRLEPMPDADLSTPLLDPLPEFDEDEDIKPTVVSTLPPTETLRPPALVDLYPRVKTPTSVPPLGSGLATGTVPSRTLMGIAPTMLPVPTHVPMRVPTSVPEYIADDTVDVEPELDLEAVVFPEQAEQGEAITARELDTDGSAMLEIYERELATVDESATTAMLRVEAGRLYERHGDLDRARAHYDAALLADPRSTIALRGLRRIARNTGDLTEATRQLDAEMEIAGALERRPLGHYRVDLLMACGEQDLARVAVGEILDSAPSDVRALLAHLELAFLDGRADEFGAALEQLAGALTDTELRAAAQSARAALAAHHNDTTAAATWFAAAAESDPQAIGARLGAVRHAAAQADAEAAAKALVELARRLEISDANTAASLALRAQQWTTGETAQAAAQIATAVAPMDPLVARLAAEKSTDGEAYAHWCACPGTPAERAYAAARAAELIPARGAELWGLALDLDPGDDYGAAQLRTAFVAAEDTAKAIDVDLAMTADATRDRARLRAAFSLIAQGQLDPAIELLVKGRAARPSSLAIAEALGEALAAGGRWADRARLFAELADEPGEQLDKDVAQLRSALAWEEAVGAAAEQGEAGSSQSGDLQRATAAALAAWDRVLEQRGGAAAAAHASAMVLASRLGDRDVLADVLARAQAAEKSPWAVTSLALRRARLYAADDPGRVEAILADIQLQDDDPRMVVALAMSAARRGEPAEVAQALEERANRLAQGTEPAALRLRAAQLALDAGDAAKATTLLGQVERALPSLGVIPDLLAAARRRAGDRPTAAPARNDAPVGGDAFARLLRDADLAAAHDDGPAALGLYQRALELRDGDPLAVVPLVRVATQLREPAPLTALALARLRAAETANDNVAKAEAYELLARIDATLRDDAGSAQIALESALQADPSRIDLVHRLERQYAATEQLSELVRLRRAALGVIPDRPGPVLTSGPDANAGDKAALVVDLAGLAARDQRPDDEIAALYRSALAAEPKHRLALLHLESIVRRPGPSRELAELEQAIAGYFDGDARSQAAFLTRAGETLADTNAIDEAVAQFNKATQVLPGHPFALEGWRLAALKGQMWADAAEAATQQAQGATDSQERARMHHFAGVALMDKALDGDRAAASFRRALDADPKLTDAFLRLRILLEENGNHEDLATLLAHRLDVEEDPTAQVELHRALADLHRNFLSDRDTAKRHFRAILAADQNDLRAHAAVADIAWEQGNWQEAADALVARARLEREPEVLKTLCYRLGLIYADRLVDVPMALKAFQRALTYSPDDENTLVRLADLATSAGEWKLALGACERLVKAEADPDRRASHLQRVARIFRDGFGDAKRAERALNLALDSAPTNDEALTALVNFYRDSGDMMSVRVHLNRVAGAMRARFEKDVTDGVACRVIARSMAARDQAGVPGSWAIARAAAELADLLGAAGDPEAKLLADGPRAEPGRLMKPESEEVLFPRGVQTELRQIFQLLGDKVAKHVGTDLRAYGVARGDRLRARDSKVAAAAQEVATGLGLAEIDVFVSTRMPYAMNAEPTSPVSLVIGQAIAAGSKTQIQFAAGSALKLAQSSLAIPARLPPEELGVLVVSLLRLFQPEFPSLGADTDAVSTQMQKLRRLIPTGLFNELRPYALAVDGQRLGSRQLAQDLRIAGLRGGLVASGSLLAGLAILAQQAQATVEAMLTDPVAAGLVSFALAEDHATVAR